jgi:hypothetical protein
MKRLTSAVVLATLLLATAATSRPALADEADMFVFGTRLVLTSPRQLADPNSGWWAEILPMEYNYAPGTLIKAVNTARAARGMQEMVAYKDYPIQLGGETPVGNGFEYNIDFMHMSPEDVNVILAQFPLTGVLSDLKTEMRPVGIGYYYANSTEPGGSIKLSLPGQALQISADDSFVSVQKMVADALAARFAGRAKFDLSLSRYTAALGTSSFDVNVTVYLDGAENNAGYPAPYEGEGGE